jgi:hypothetical protein
VPPHPKHPESSIGEAVIKEGALGALANHGQGELAWAQPEVSTMRTQRMGDSVRWVMMRDQPHFRS